MSASTGLPRHSIELTVEQNIGSSNNFIIFYSRHIREMQSCCTRFNEIEY